MKCDIIMWCWSDDPLAQMAEHMTFNHGVRSSTLRWVTNFGTVSVLTRSATAVTVAFLMSISSRKAIKESFFGIGCKSPHNRYTVFSDCSYALCRLEKRSGLHFFIGRGRIAVDFFIFAVIGLTCNPPLISVPTDGAVDPHR